MVGTPWGDASELRERQLPPGPATPREAVDRNQRERLFAAMVATATRKGYAQTSVADLVALSGVSRSSFYRHFCGKEDCFLATLDEILTAAIAVTASRLHNEGSLLDRAEQGLRAFFELLVDQPAAARLCLVEAYAAGPAAIERLDRALEKFQSLVGGIFEERPSGPEMPAEMIRGMTGGLRKIVHTRLHRGSERELLDLVPDLVEFGFGYRAPPAALRNPRRRYPPWAPSQAVPWGDASERIVQATAAAVAAKGYATTSVADIIEVARISFSTFYDHFDDKEDAFDAALYAGRARMLGQALPAYRRARSWPEAIRATTEATLAFLAAEPEFTQLIAVEVYAAGPEALERRDRAIELAQRFIDAGVAEHSPGMKPFVREAIVSIFYAMICERARNEGARSLPAMAPLATYMALAPFIGPEEACAVANGGRPVPVAAHR